MASHSTNSAESSSSTPRPPRLNSGPSWLSLGRSRRSMEPRWTRTCPHCSRTFGSSQAFGGHQNAHRRERTEARKRFLESPQAKEYMATVLCPTPLRIVPPIDYHNTAPPAPAVATPASEQALWPAIGLQLSGLANGPQYGIVPLKPTVGNGPHSNGYKSEVNSPYGGRNVVGEGAREKIAAEPAELTGSICVPARKGGKGGSEACSDDGLDLTLRLSLT